MTPKKIVLYYLLSVVVQLRINVYVYVFVLYVLVCFSFFGRSKHPFETFCEDLVFFRNDSNFRLMFQVVASTVPHAEHEA